MFSTTLNPATWSLQVEWLFSIMVPIIYFGIGRALLPNLVILGLLYVISHAFGSEALHMLSTSTPWAYLYMCYAGFVVAIAMTELKTALNRVPKRIIIGSTVAAFLICLTTPHFGYHRLLFTVAGTYLIGVIALDIAPSFFRVLDASPLIVLGDISYSFYLLNPLCLILAGKVLCLCVPVTMLDRHVWLSTIVLFLLSVLLTTPFSYLSYYFCERPFASSHKKAKMADTVVERILAPQIQA